jgi:GTP1/Obg family GTP-binding protein
VNSNLTPDRRLARTLRAVGERYEAACVAARQLQDAPATQATGPLTELHHRLAAIAEQEAELSDVRRDWERGGRPWNQELRRLVTEQTARLEELLAAVHGCLARLEAARDQLRPELDVAVRRQAMQRAYGAEKKR